MRLRRYLPITMVSALLLSVALPSVVGAQDTKPESESSEAPVQGTTNPSETYRQLNLFGDVFERVRSQYVEPVTDETLMKYAINGMLSSLDPHSSYLDDKDFKEMQVQTKGEFGGLGIEVTMDQGIVKVVSPIDDTPAYRAGIKAGDYITHLDDEQIVGLNLNEAVEKMRGKVGSPIKITVRREGVPDPIEVTIIRDVIKIQSVKSEILQDNIGYVRITTFNQNTDTGTRAAVEKIKSQVGKDLVGFIIDMRNNPGGLLDQAISVSDDFLEQGEIVSTRGRHPEDTKRDNATPGDIADGLPIVVLINGGSASASEIVAGALQDHRRALLLGTQSFGKGSVQTVIPLSGHGAMRLTTARYYTPSGVSIQAKGITPDIIIEPAKIEQVAAIQRIKESDLRGALSNPQAPVETTIPAEVLPGNKPEADLSKSNGAKDKDGAADDKVAEDYQLSRAIDLLRGVSLYDQRKDTGVPMPKKSQPAADNGAKIDAIIDGAIPEDGKPPVTAPMTAPEEGAPGN